MIQFALLNASFEDTQKEVIEKMIAENKPLGFCYDKDGQFYKMTRGPLGIITTKAEPKALTGDDTKEVKEGFVMVLPKIPLNILSQIVSFFRDICDESGDEVFARIYYDKEEGVYFPYVPPQKISKANVTYNITDKRFQTEDRYLFVLDIHSHNTMSAFFSGTDNSDEKSSGKIFMVIGQLDKETPMYKIRTYQEPNHIEIDLFDAFEKPENITAVAETEYGTFTYEVPAEQIISKVLEKVVEYPADWKDQIEKTVYSYGRSSSFSYGNGYDGFTHPSYSGAYSKYGRQGQLSLFGDVEPEEDDAEAFFSRKKYASQFKPKHQATIDYEGDIPEDEDYDDIEEIDMADDFEELSPEERYYLGKEEIAPAIADIISSSTSDSSEMNFVVGLKEGLVEAGLGHLIKELGKEG